MLSGQVNWTKRAHSEQAVRVHTSLGTCSRVGVGVEIRGLGFNFMSHFCIQQDSICILD